MSNVVHLRDPYRESDRFKAVHVKHVALSAFAAELGTPDDWLITALGHLKVQLGSGDNGGTVEVSSAALTLLIWKLEEVAFGGAPWTN